MSKTKTTQAQKFSKSAFLNATESTNERVLLQVLLEDGKTYSKEEVEKLVESWKKKEVEA